MDVFKAYFNYGHEPNEVPIDLRSDFRLMGKYSSFNAAQHMRRAGYHPLRHVPNHQPYRYEIVGMSPFFFHAAPSHEPIRHTSNAWVMTPP